MISRKGIEKWIEDGHWPSIDFPEEVLQLYDDHVKLQNEHAKLKLKYDRVTSQCKA